MKLPESWVEVRLSDICTLNPKLSREEQPSETTEVTFVPMSAVDETAGVICNPELRNYKEVAKGYTSFRERDVLFAKVTPCMENGKAAIVGQLSNGYGFGSTEFHVLRSKEFVLPEYIFHFIRQKAFRERAASAFQGTGGLQRVPSTFLSRIKIPLPTLHEQQRIVDVVRKMEYVTKTKKSIEEKIERLISTAYWDYFGDWYTEDGLRDAVRISDYVADSQYGVSEAMHDSGEQIVLRMNSITRSGWLNLTDFKYATLSNKDVEATTLRNGDLLFNRTNSKELVGKCAIWRNAKGSFSFASYLVRLRLKEGMLPEFLWATLNSEYGKYRLFNSAKQAVSMANISPTDLGRIIVPLPPIKLQEKFVQLVNQIEALREKMLSNLREYDDLQSFIAQQALVGELTVTWRNENAELINEAANIRNSLLRERGTEVIQSPKMQVASRVSSYENERPARQWIVDELSDFQRKVLAAFHAYAPQPLLAEDAKVFAQFCESDEITDRLSQFGSVLNNRIRRTLSQLASLGMIAKITLPKDNQETGEREYLKAFRPLREEEYSRLQDVAELRELLTISEVGYFFRVEQDFETSANAGAAGLFQVLSLSDDNDNDYTDLVDVGQHYHSLEELKNDLAKRLNVRAEQIDLETE